MDQIPDVLPRFDGALNQECFESDECETQPLFVQTGKAVFNVEYGLETAQFFGTAKALGLNFIR